ncbi:MAG: hypothetical protein MJZ76_06255 [Bacteroidales bacterium]|nr:hypothetical protein [Bacteroidales bacterium]
MRLKLLVISITLIITSKAGLSQDVKVKIIPFQVLDSLTQVDNCYTFYSNNLEWRFAIISPFFTKQGRHPCMIKCDSLTDTLIVPINITYRIMLKNNSPYIVYDSLWISDNYIYQEKEITSGIINRFLSSLNYLSTCEPNKISKREQIFFPIVAIPSKEINERTH